MQFNARLIDQQVIAGTESAILNVTIASSKGSMVCMAFAHKYM